MSIQSGMPWLDGSAPIVGDGWVQIGGSDSPKIYWDQLSQADQDLVIQYLLSAQYPVLAPPQEAFASQSGNNAIGGVGQIDQKQHEIIMGMLDGWLKSLQEQAERSKRDDEKKTIEGLSTAYHTYQHDVSLQTDPNFALFAVGMIIVGTGIHQALLINQNTLGVEFNPVVNMSDKAMTPIAGDMRAELGLIGAIYSAGIQYFTVAQIASQSINGKEKPSDSAFAKGYAENVITLLGTPHFNSYLLAIVTRGSTEAEPLTEERIQELVAMVKIILLSSALTMLYKAEAGKMTSLEFAAMLNGTIAFPAGDIRATLVAMINSNLKVMSPSTKEKVLSALLEYLDSDPSIESLGDPAKVFAGLYGTLSRGEVAG